MPNIHDVFKDEEVNGFIIGGDYVCAKLEYDGRQQGEQIYAKDKSEAERIAMAMKHIIKRELGYFFSEIYPEDKKWRIVFYG